MKFDYANTPVKRKKRGEFEENDKVLISVVMAYYNGHKYVDESLTVLLNQTFPLFEILIVNDGSNKKESLDKLDELAKKDKRIKVLHKNNGGLASARNYGIEHVSEESKYIYIYDDDDLIEPEFFEKAYWAMETNKDAAFCYSSLVAFGEVEYLYREKYDSYREVHENVLISESFYRKDVLLNNKYDETKGIHEDWIMHLNVISKGGKPLHLGSYDFWYRIKNSNESLRLINNQKENLKKTEKVKKDYVKKILKNGKDYGYHFPVADYFWDKIEEPKEIYFKKKQNNKVKVLCIFPWMNLGGADRFNIDFINMLDSEKFEFYVITTLPSTNPWKDKIINKVDGFYDLPNFLDQKYWGAFIDSIIKQNNIDICMVSNSSLGYQLIPYLKISNPDLVFTDYIHNGAAYDRGGGFPRDMAALTQFIDLTCTCNNLTTNQLINNYGINKEKVKTVYIGVDTDKFDPAKIDKDEAYTKLKLENYKDKKIISFIARIDLQKRPYLCAEIMNRTTREDVHFVIAGDGSMLEEMKRRTQNPNVTFLGSISNPELLYRISDITLNCSIIEGLALTAYESLSMGVPVITSDVGGQKELVDNTVGAVIPCLQKEEDAADFNYSEEEVIPYVKAIDKILLDLENYKKRSRTKVLENFSLKNMAEDMSNVFENLKENPNKQNIEFAKCFNNNLRIAKELYVKHLLLFNNEQRYLIEEYNYQTGYKKYKRSIKNNIIGFLWKFKLYRCLIKVKQKIFGKRTE